MTPKGPSHVDLESADSARSRRQLLGALGAAGVAGAAALTLSRPASAAPSTPTDADKAQLRPVMEIELAARDLYLAAAAGLSEEAAVIADEFAANHAAYADAIAGASGFSANTRNDELFDEHAGDFSGGEAAFVAAAVELENALSATHSELFGGFESSEARKLASSIAVVEARMATILVEFGGDPSNLDALLEPTAQPIDLEGSGA